MGHNPTKNPFRRARLELDVGTQEAVDQYKTRSVWSAWWKLDESVRRRYFTKDERDFITRYGARLDEIACFRTNPNNEDEAHFLRVCMGEENPRTPRERLWLIVQLACRYERAVERAARADLAEHDAAALRQESRALKAKSDHLERYVATLFRDLQVATGEVQPRVTSNVRWVSPLFDGPVIFGPHQPRRVITATSRGVPVSILTADGIRPLVVTQSAG